MTKLNDNAKPAPKRSKYKADGTLDMSETVGDEFEEVFDTFSDLASGRMRSRGHHQDPDYVDPIQGERERIKLERELTSIANAMRNTLADMLRTQGFMVTAVTFDKEYNFRISCVDATGLMFPIMVPLDAMNELSDLNSHRGYLAICEHVTRQILAARERYGARSGRVLGVS